MGETPLSEPEPLRDAPVLGYHDRLILGFGRGRGHKDLNGFEFLK